MWGRSVSNILKGSIEANVLRFGSCGLHSPKYTQLRSAGKPLLMGLRVPHQWAYAFRFDAAHRSLRLRLSQQRSERLSSIYHLIGRLGYWHKASFSLVRTSANFADVLRRATVSLLELDEPGSDPRPRLDRDLESLALKVLPNFRGTALSSALVHSMRSSTDLLDWFGDRSVKCRPHAEAAVTD